MAQKAEIQYVSRFYVFGSEVPNAAPKEKKNGVKLPQLHLERPRKVYIDPIALCGVVAAVVMLCLLVAGMVHLRDTRAEYDRMKAHLVELKLENAQLNHTYHTSFTVDEVRDLAESQGVVRSDEAERFTAFVIVPDRPREKTAWENFLWRLSWLFSRSEDYDLAQWNTEPVAP